MRVSDWSSDVCSSELQFVPAVALAPIVESVDVDKQTLWRRSLVEFDDETVGAAVAELNRYSATQIVVADSRVAAMRMSGIVKTGDAGEFTTLVGAMLPVASRKKAHGDIELYYTSEEHTSELPSLMPTSYAVSSLK